jgi:RecJ-like exonuclease
MAASQITFSSTGSLQAGFDFPNSEHRKGHMETVLKVTVVNSEVVTIKHGSDADRVREVRIIRANGQQVREPATVDTNTGATVVRTDAETTTITFGSGAAGSYTIFISL